MRITVVGAAGMTGSRIVTEALARGHEVTAVTRGPRPLPSGVTPFHGDATDIGRMASLFTGADAVVGATRPAPGTEGTVTKTTTALLDAAAVAETRILFVGGSAPLLTPSGGLAIDNPQWVPVEYHAIAAASIAQLEACRAHAADWVCLSPPAVLEPGVRTGSYRRGGTSLLIAEDGTSRISVEDYAVAVLDELENPGQDRHFTVGV